MKLLIKNARLLDPATETDKKGSLAVAKGRIVAMGRKPNDFTPDKEIDAAGRWACPGIIDLGARFREPGLEHKAAIAGEARAAAAGGITTVCYPPDTDPVIDTSAVVELIHRRADASGRIRIHPIAALTRGLAGEYLAEMAELKEAGCVAAGNAGRPIVNTQILRRALEYAASVGLPVFIQPEDSFLRNNGVAHEGAMSTRLGLPPIAETAETVALQQALLLVEQTGVRAHFCRLSTARSAAMIGAAKKSGLPVTADAAVANLFLTDMDIDGYNTDCHLIPPLRGQADRDALLRGVADGTIDAVCSDHQPHDFDAKAAPFSLSEPGASTLEVLLPLMLERVQRKAMTPLQMLRCLTAAPAAVIGLESGTLRKDANADIIIVDPDRSWTVDREAMLSSGRNTPFHGWEMSGRVTHTILGGRLVFEG
ncbi:MAG: dihydroorotase [Gammaproteobacteria bacterium]